MEQAHTQLIAQLNERILAADNTPLYIKFAETVKNAVDKAASIAARQTAESNIETLLKAKGFTETLAVIGDNDINIVVRSESLSAAQTLQIQDIARAQSGYTVDKIKILTVK